MPRNNFVWQDVAMNGKNSYVWHKIPIYDTKYLFMTQNNYVIHEIAMYDTKQLFMTRNIYVWHEIAMSYTK